MTNKPIDWMQPIELDTDPPRPATLRWVYPDGSGADVYADWFGNEGDDWMPTGNDGFVDHNYPCVRNVRPGDFESAEPTPDLAAELAEALRELRDNIAAASLARNDNGKRVRAMADAALAKWDARK